MSTLNAPTLEMLRERKDEIVQTLRKYNAGNVRVFGSVARGEATPESDIDLICDYDPDWYRFTIDRPQSVRIDALFSHSGGDLDVQLFNVNEVPVGFGVSVDDNEVIETEELPAGQYFIKVYGIQDVQNSYRIFKTSGNALTADFSNNMDIEIPDATADETGVLESAPANFPNIPDGAVVRQLTVTQLDINHGCLADLEVILKWDGEPIVYLWNREGENCLDAGLDDDSALSIGCFAGVGAARWNGRLGNDICFENRIYNEFAGLDAQGDLTVEVIDHNPDNDGSVVNMSFSLEYLIP